MFQHFTKWLFGYFRAKTMITYFLFYNVKISVKIRDLRAHFAVAGQTHSGLVSYLIPSINPGVSMVLFCHDLCYKVTHTAQRNYTVMWPMRSLLYHYMTNQRTRGLWFHVTHDQWRLSWLGHVMRDSWHAFMTQYPEGVWLAKTLHYRPLIG